ncbi:MAG: class I SAM-dependent methyltransferase [Thermoleophilia bacterium]|nr:class I SAM-dependent methyltransferase [Thermoleophilia bacterium]
MAYSRSASVYDALYSFKDYAGEAALLERIVRARNGEARTLLDVACGTGKHLAELRRHFQVEGLDLEPGLVEIARTRLPGIPVHHADMVSFALERRFDVVTCLFSSIGYVRTPARLRRTIATLARHLERRGVLVLEPWIRPDQWELGGPYSLFVDEPELKVARVNLSPPAGKTVVLEMHHVVGRPDGVESFVERHELGMFTHEEYVGALAAAGLDLEHDPDGLSGRGLYVATRGA